MNTVSSEVVKWVFVQCVRSISAAAVSLYRKR